jgi:hypothetical protein
MRQMQIQSSQELSGPAGCRGRMDGPIEGQLIRASLRGGLGRQNAGAIGR